MQDAAAHHRHCIATTHHKNKRRKSKKRKKGSHIHAAVEKYELHAQFVAGTSIGVVHCSGDPSTLTNNRHS